MLTIAQPRGQPSARHRARLRNNRRASPESALAEQLSTKSPGRRENAPEAVAPRPCSQNRVAPASRLVARIAPSVAFELGLGIPATGPAPAFDSTPITGGLRKNPKLRHDRGSVEHRSSSPAQSRESTKSPAHGHPSASRHDQGQPGLTCRATLFVERSAYATPSAPRGEGAQQPRPRPMVDGRLRCGPPFRAIEMPCSV